MDVTLTDLLVCPHCGPPYALILLADTVRERRVLAGTLGCANCYRRFEVREGLADLRTSPATSQRTPASAQRSGPTLVRGTHDPLRLAALMGLSDATGSGRAIALLAGSVATEAAAVAGVAEGYEIVAADDGEGDADAARLPEVAGVSRMLVSARLPFADGGLRGVVLSGGEADRLLEEGVRVLNPMGRLVLQDAPAGAAERIAAAGGRVLAAEGSTVVAVTLRALGAGP